VKSAVMIDLGFILTVRSEESRIPDVKTGSHTRNTHPQQQGDIIHAHTVGKQLPESVALHVQRRQSVEKNVSLGGHRHRQTDTRQYPLRKSCTSTGL
jgi:hypothetical protein